MFGRVDNSIKSEVILVNVVFEYDNTELTDNLRALIQIGTGGAWISTEQTDKGHLNAMFGGGFKYKIQKKLDLFVVGNTYMGQFQNFGSVNLGLTYYIN